MQFINLLVFYKLRFPKFLL